jgi:hypothetical protein
VSGVADEVPIDDASTDDAPPHDAPPHDGATPGAAAGRSPVDQVLDYCVYAPLGLALDARSLLPGLIDRGRGQVGMARMVGEFAVKWGSTRVESAVGDAQEQAMCLLRRTGLAPATDRDRGAGSGEDDQHGAPGATDGAEAPTVEPEPEPEVDEGPPVAVESLAIPDYDNLSASQVVPRLDGLSPDELEAVRRYESANRRRRTILNKVAQLQDPLGAPEP